MKEVYLTTEAERRYRKAYYERNKARILQKKKERYHADVEHARADNKRHNLNTDRSEYFRQRYLQQKEIYHQRYLARKEREKNE